MKEGDTLTEDYILKQDRARQEICNQLNRRTEFIVLRTTYGLFDEKGQLKTQPKPQTKNQEKTEKDDFEFVE